MQQLTDRQQQVKNFICEYREKNQFSPSLRDIAEHFDFCSANAAKCHVDVLIAKGHLTSKPYTTRSMVPIMEGNKE